MNDSNLNASTHTVMDTIPLQQAEGCRGLRGVTKGSRLKPGEAKGYDRFLTFVQFEIFVSALLLHWHSRVCTI
jgi:hypothetical protein